MLSTFFFYGASAVLVLRLAFGAIVIVHGWNKLKNLKQTNEWFASVGFRPGAFWGTFAALLEFVGGIAIAVGIFVQPLAALFALEFIAIIFWRLVRHSAFIGGWELDLIILAAAIALLSLGGGAYSLDRALLLNIF